VPTVAKHSSALRKSAGREFDTDHTRWGARTVILASARPLWRDHRVDPALGLMSRLERKCIGEPQRISIHARVPRSAR